MRVGAGFFVAFVVVSGSVILPDRPAGADTCPSHLFTPAGVSQPTQIVAGPDGNLWFASEGNDRIARITTAGEVTSWAAGGSTPSGVTVGPDEHLWFTLLSPEEESGALVEIDPAAPEDGPEVHPLAGVEEPVGITAGPDDGPQGADGGDLYVTGHGNDVIARVATDGTVEDTWAAAAGPATIIEGPDAELWYTALDEPSAYAGHTGALVRSETDGGEPEILATRNSSGPFGLAVGPWEALVGDDRDLVWVSWFTESLVAVHFAHGDQLSAWSGPDLEGPFLLAKGPDGTILGSTTSSPGRIMRISGANDPLRGSLPVQTYWAGGASSTYGVAEGPDGNMWFTDPVGGHIGYVDTDQPGPRFPDVALSHPFCDDIAWMDQAGISTGYEQDRTYRPATPVTRGAMAAFLNRLLGYVASQGSAAGGATLSNEVDSPTQAFSDVTGSYAFYEEIEALHDAGIVEGFPDGTYRPGAPMSRGAMAAFLYRLARVRGEPSYTPPASPTFPADVPGPHPFSTEIEWLAEHGVTRGYDDGTFRPGATITRQAMSAFMQRMADHLAGR